MCSWKNTVSLIVLIGVVLFKDFYIPAKLVSSRAHNDGWLEEEHVTTLKPGGIYGHYKKIGAVLSTSKDMK